MPTVPQLKAELKQLGVKGYSKKLKGELIYMLVAFKKANAKEEVKKPEPVKIAIKDIREKRPKPKIGKSWAEKDEEDELELRKLVLRKKMNDYDIPPPPEPPRRYIEKLFYATDLGARDTATYKIYGLVSPINAINGAINGFKIRSKGIPELQEYCDNVLNWIEKIKVPSSRGFVVLMKDWEKLRGNIKILHNIDEFMRKIKLSEDKAAQEKAEQKKAEQKRAEQKKAEQDDYEMKQHEKQLKIDIENALSAMGANRRFVKKPTAAQKATGTKFVLGGFQFV